MSKFTTYTPSKLLDIRCEYDVPRFIDLNIEDDSQYTQVQQDDAQEEEFFKWFQISHDFKVSRKQVLNNKD